MQESLLCAVEGRISHSATTARGKHGNAVPTFATTSLFELLYVRGGHGGPPLYKFCDSVRVAHGGASLDKFIIESVEGAHGGAPSNKINREFLSSR